MRSGTAFCRESTLEPDTATAFTGPSSRKRVTGSIPTSCLIDPYARAIEGDIAWGQATYGYIFGQEAADLSFDETDSASSMPKCVVVDSRAKRTGAATRRPAVPWARTIVYETHVRGFTQLHPAIPENAARHVRGARPPGGRRLCEVARDHVDRASPDPLVRRRRPSACQGPEELLGIQFAGLLRPGESLSGPARPRRVCAT